MEFRNFGTQLWFQIIIGFFELFWWMGNSKGFSTSHYTQHFYTIFISYGVLCFFFKCWRWICPKLPNFAKICPKTISLRNFELPPKTEIFYLFPKKKLLYVEEVAKHLFTIWIFDATIFDMPFLLSENCLVCEFQYTPLWEIIFFSMFHTSYGYEIL
jgi:hypothetical protein